jgi:tetratricopeptide (TPR) repeat protein
MLVVGGVLLAGPAAPQAGPELTYATCLARIDGDAETALRSSLAWREAGGGVPARHCTALALMALGYFVEAARHLGHIANVVEDDGLRAEVLGQASQAWLRAGDAGRAFDAATSALEADPGNVDLLIDRAQAAAEEGDFDRVVIDLDRVLAQDPGHSEAWAFRASAERQRGNLDRAADDIAEALRLNPGEPGALLERGNIARLRGDDAGARADWLRVLVDWPDSSAAQAAQTNLEALDVKVE